MGWGVSVWTGGRVQSEPAREIFFPPCVVVGYCENRAQVATLAMGGIARYVELNGNYNQQMSTIIPSSWTDQVLSELDYPCVCLITNIILGNFASE